MTIESLLGIKTKPSHQEIRLFERAQKYLGLVRWIPGLRMIAVCNSLAMYATDGDSDIDVFVVSDPKRMWLVRFLLTGIFQILGVRRYGKKVKGRFCLSFFCTIEALDMGKIAIENDIYLEAWVHYLKPILDVGNTYETFVEANRSWMTQYFPTNTDARNFLSIKKPLQEERFTGILDKIDSWCQRICEPMTLREFDRIGKPWGVIISDSMLKFHPRDKRRGFRDSSV